MSKVALGNRGHDRPGASRRGFVAGAAALIPCGAGVDKRVHALHLFCGGRDLAIEGFNCTLERTQAAGSGLKSCFRISDLGVDRAELLGLRRYLAVLLDDARRVLLHLEHQGIGGFGKRAHVEPIGRVGRWIAGGGCDRLKQPIAQAHYFARGIGLGVVVLQRIGDFTDQVFQFLFGSIKPVTHRPRTGTVNQLQPVEQVFAQLGLADFAGNHLQDRPGFSTGLPHHPVFDRVKWSNVAGTIHQPRPEKELRASGQTLQAVVVLRVGQIRQLGGVLQAIGRAVPDLSALGIVCTWWETPLEADFEEPAVSGQVADRGRQAFLAVQLGKLRRFPDRGNIKRTDRTHTGQISARVDAGDVHAGRARALHLDPVPAVLAPLNVISDGTCH